MTRHPTFRSAALALSLVILVAPAVAQDAAHDMSAMDHPAPPAGSASARYMEAMKTMDDAMGAAAMTGQPGHDFAAMMIPHHQSAIDMAKAYLASGDSDPVLTKLSNDIVASQEAEIAELKTWLAAHPAE